MSENSKYLKSVSRIPSNVAFVLEASRTRYLLDFNSGLLLLLLLSSKYPLDLVSLMMSFHRSLLWCSSCLYWDGMYGGLPWSNSRLRLCYECWGS